MNQLSRVSLHQSWQLRDKRGEFRLIDKSDLKIDDDYQREASGNKVQAIARGWSWIACGAIIVGERDGMYYVVDGQHRVMAARRIADIRELPALVYQTESKKEEAQGFLNANTRRKPMTSIDRFKASLVVGDPIAIRAQQLIVASGRAVNLSAHSGTVACVGVIQRRLQEHGAAFENLWPLLVEVCEGHAFNGKLLDGLLYIEVHLPAGQSLMDRRWRERILSAGYGRVLTGANRGAAFFAHGGKKAWASGIVEELNKNCRIRLELRS
jgi:hypothetical protein